MRKLAVATMWRSATPLELAEQSVDSTDRAEIVEVAKVRPPDLVMHIEDIFVPQSRKPQKVRRSYPTSSSLCLGMVWRLRMEGWDSWRSERPIQASDGAQFWVLRGVV